MQSPFGAKTLQADRSGVARCLIRGKFYGWGTILCFNNGVMAIWPSPFMMPPLGPRGGGVGGFKNVELILKTLF